jgi:CheY-like chemotaxis protein
MVLWREMGRAVPFAPKLRSRLTYRPGRERGRVAVGKEVLVVDDDVDVRESLSEVLSEAGYRVHAASSGEEALAMVPRLPRPCLILLDNNMPRMSGRDFLWRLVDVDDSARLPVILISATADAESATVPGVVATLWKPFDVATLLKLVANHCD